MRHKLGEELVISFLVLNKENQRVTTANPSCQIFNTRTNKYWNGVVWQDSEVNLSMTHSGDGVYVYKINPTEIGVYEVRMYEYISDTYKSYDVSVENFGDNDVGLIGYTGEITTIRFLAINGEGMPHVSGAKVSIYNDKSHKYYSDNYWHDTEQFNEATHLEEGLYVFDFPSKEEGYYTVRCETLDGIYLTTYPLRIIDSRYKKDPDAPVHVSSNTLLGEDGSNSIVVDEYGIPIEGVDVSIYSDAGKLYTKTITKKDGDWEALLKPGKYIFVFEKNGYTTSSVERVVGNADNVIEIV